MKKHLLSLIAILIGTAFLASCQRFENLTLCSEATKSQLNTIQVGMKKSIYLLAMLGLFAACEQKTTTVNPPDKKESNTTIVNPPGSSTTTTKEEKKTDINVNTSPNP
jgi:uncharacterized lipoprotein YajG